MADISKGKIIIQIIMAVFKKILQFGGRLISSKKSAKFTVSIEGNIGSGKTCFLNFLQNNPLCQVLAEPVDRWRNVNGENALAKLYEDPQRWSLALQTYVQLTMLQSHLLKQSRPVKLMERSIFSAKYCFVENLRESGLMSKMEYDILTEWFDWIVSTQDVNVDLIVYLRTKPEVLHDRIALRGRKEEKPIPVEYLRTLHDLHDAWLIDKKFPVPCPVLVINANVPLDEMERTCARHQKQILFGLEA